MRLFKKSVRNKKILHWVDNYIFYENIENIKKRYTNVDQKIQSTQKANQQFNWHGDFIEVDHETYMDRYTLSKDVRDFVMEKGSGSFQANPDKDSFFLST